VPVCIDRCKQVFLLRISRELLGRSLPHDGLSLLQELFLRLKDVRLAGGV
jgi:hypothetical protein